MVIAVTPLVELPVLSRSLARRCAWRSSLQLMVAGVVMTLVLGGTADRSREHVPSVAPAMGGPFLPTATLEPATGGQEAVPLHDALEMLAAMQHLHRLHDAQRGEENELTRLPVQPVRITSGFGRRTDPFGRGKAFHSGVDFAAPAGTPVRAAGDGLVVDASFHKDYGNVVRINHGDGCITLYGHNRKLLVHTGDVVLAGQEIAEVGSTGRSTGPHLHFEVREDGQRVDPKRYLAGL